MLTKEERKAIAERLNKCEGLGELYYAVIGEELPTVTSYEQDVDAIFTRLSDLCDTSNMIELPVDKDGEVIKLDDTVYSKYGTESIVDRISYHKDRITITTYTTDGFESDVYYGWELTHKNSVTVASLAERVRDVLENTDVVDALDDFRTGKFYDELWAICGELERLSDNDE